MKPARGYQPHEARRGESAFRHSPEGVKAVRSHANALQRPVERVPGARIGVGVPESGKKLPRGPFPDFPHTSWR